jgi:hypothetical protein
MPVNLVIHIPLQEYEHYDHLVKLKMCDCHRELWTILNKYDLNIDESSKIRFVVYNSPFGLAFEYQLLNISSNKEVESSDIFLQMNDSWLMCYRGEKYRVTIEPGN